MVVWCAQLLMCGRIRAIDAFMTGKPDLLVTLTGVIIKFAASPRVLSIACNIVLEVGLCCLSLSLSFS